MSSKGKQAVTNDGSDSKYREKVADHYKGLKPFSNTSITQVRLRIENCESQPEVVLALHVYGQRLRCCSFLHEEVQGRRVHI